MKAVYKYALDSDNVYLPAGAEIIHVGLQNNELFAWALVPLHDVAINEEKVHTFRVAGTGHPIQEYHASGRFWGTFLMLNGFFVVHVWQLK